MSSVRRMISITMALILAFLSFSNGIFALNTFAQATETVEVWKRTDIILSSEAEYANPYSDVTVSALFRHQDGTELELYGFWNGKNEWRIRFSPTKIGVWSYTTECSNPDDSGLHGINGSVTATPNTGTTELDRHGFVRISDNGRHFAYQDGTPFFWLGDTNWQAPNYVSTTQCNYPGCLCENQFQHEVDDRLAKGFNVYQTYFDSGENDGGGQLATTSEPSLWTERHVLINPDTFTDKIDGMFDYLAENGMVIALGYGVHTHTINGMSEKALMDVTRYLTARYASYPIVWITAQEINLSSEAIRIWSESAKIVDAMDPYNHPQSAHMWDLPATDSRVSILGEQPWHEWWAVQGGHAKNARNKEYYQGYWDAPGAKPFIETELKYEDITCGGFNIYEWVRQGAWKACMNGSYGFTYGATGIWANNYSTAGNMGWYQSYSFEPWYMGLDKPGSFEMTYMKYFFEYCDFPNLVPRFNDSAYSNFTAEEKNVMASEDGSTFAAYFYNADLSTGILRGLNSNESYSARWYNPLTGKFIDIASDIEVDDGTYRIPIKPTKNDWVLLVTSRDFGPYDTESTYHWQLPENKNLALGAIATASSDNSTSGNFSPSSAVDGQYNTYWCAKNGDMPQWFEVDLGESKDMKRVEMYLSRGAGTVPTERMTYTLTGSNDSKIWDVIHSGVDEASKAIDNMDFFRISFEGKYRYLHVEFKEIITNWATLIEFEVYADDVDEEVISDNKNAAIGALATASSQSGTGNSPDKAVDGNINTWWCASSGDMPQWLQFDLHEETIFNSIQFSMYGGTSTISYTLKGSNDAAGWNIIAQGEDVTLIQEPRASILRLDNLSGSYRYLKLEFIKVEGNWATIVEFNVYNIEGSAVDLAPGSTAAASSDTGSKNSAAKALDGDRNTYWCASSDKMPQWFRLDLGVSKQFQYMDLYMVSGTSQVSFTIKGSDKLDDLSDQTPFYQAVGAKTLNKDGLSFLRMMALGRYRYLLIEFSEVQGNWATISALEIYNSEPVIEQEGKLPEYGGVHQLPVVKSVGTGIYNAKGDYSNTDLHLFDGDISTDWTPYGPIGTQTILMDLLESNKLNGMIITLGSGAMLPKFRIDASNNNKDWTVLVDSKLHDAEIVKKDDRIYVCHPLFGEFRYVKLIWGNAPSNSSLKTISELELFAENTTPTHSSKPRITALLANYLQWKNQNNSAQQYADTNWRTLQQALWNARYILSHLDSISQSQADEANNALIAAIDALCPPATNLEALLALIDEVNGLNAHNYTANSWNAMLEIFVQANALLENPDVSQTDVNTMGTLLRAALDALIPFETEIIPVQKVKIDASALFTLSVKKKAQISAMVMPANATDQSLTWISTNTNIFTVDQYGNITPKKQGTATLTAQSSNGLKSTIIVRITA